MVRSTSFQHMWARPFRVDMSHEIADSAGYNVDGNIYYVDIQLADAIKAGKLVVPGFTSDDILHAILIHEHTEKCTLDADNPIDSYLSAHEFATLAEHEFVRSKGAKPYEYEAALRPYIKANETKPLTNVPRDLDAEPYVDDPDADDKVAIEQMVKLGVSDAAKLSKQTVNYGKATGQDKCVQCAHWMARKPVELSPCERISGAVRHDRWCKSFEAGQAQDEPPQVTSPPIVPQQAANNPPMPGAVRAPDGHWYVLDPHRRGKFLRVV